jgi:CheY-like chemotaxis protein
MVLDLGLPDMTGFDFINKLKNELQIEDVPIVVYTGRDLTRKEEAELKGMAEAIIVKDVSSPDRLLDETALFLHRVEANLPEHKRQMLEQLHESDPVLANRTALIVDDDMRNIYALTSLLERHKMKVLYAESGKEGIEALQKTPGIDVVLMDVMMPEMDGYEAMRRVREMEEFKNLPMIALTAKAMKGDREKCMEAGASDYITKPIDAQQLVSLLRVWLYR